MPRSSTCQSNSLERIEMHVMARMIRRRLELGWTRKVFAHRISSGDKLPRSEVQIRKYDSGRDRMYSALLHEIATALEVELDYFFEDVECEVDTDAIPHLSMILGLEKDFMKMGPKMQKQICNLALRDDGLVHKKRRRTTKCRSRIV
jgi:transcriptional regulator with XRE-family HTH domain